MCGRMALNFSGVVAQLTYEFQISVLSGKIFSLMASSKKEGSPYANTKLILNREGRSFLFALLEIFIKDKSDRWPTVKTPN